MNKETFHTKEMGLFTSVMLLISPLLLIGCHTMEGMGTDVKEAGKSLERSAERNKPNASPCSCCGCQ